MGKLVKLILLAMVLCVSIILIIRYSNKSSLAEQTIYASNIEVNFMDRILYSFSLEDYRNHFNEFYIDKGASFQLIGVRLKDIIHPPYIILKTKEEGKTYLIKNSLDMVEGEPDCFNYESYIINLEAFNLYCGLAGIKEKEKIIKKYIYLVHFDSIEEMAKHIVVNQPQEIDSIKYLYSENKSILKKINTGIFSKQFNESRIYVWYKCCGLIEYYFFFNGKNLDRVESKFIGQIGNETSYMHDIGCR